MPKNTQKIIQVFYATKTHDIINNLLAEDITKFKEVYPEFKICVIGGRSQITCKGCNNKKKDICAYSTYTYDKASVRNG